MTKIKLPFTTTGWKSKKNPVDVETGEVSEQFKKEALAKAKPKKEKKAKK